jgi:hypothetical protein
MNGFIFGFQRLVWCPKCTPASSSSFIETTAMGLCGSLLVSPPDVPLGSLRPWVAFAPFIPDA